MHNIALLRDNKEEYEQKIGRKVKGFSLNKLLKLDAQNLKLKFEYDQLRSMQNKVSKNIAAKKRAGEKTESLISQMRQVATEIKEVSLKLSDISPKLQKHSSMVPNTPHNSVPKGHSCSENRVIKHWGKKREFGFAKRDFLEIAQKNKMVSFKEGAKITGSGFPVYRGFGARLERALINFMLDFHTKKQGFTELSTPFVVNRTSMIGTGQLPKMEDDMYHIDIDDMFLIPTAEVPLTNFFRDRILDEFDFPIKVCGYSPCFRREAGSYGKETKGLKRLHQFNKVELVNIAHPQDSYSQLSALTQDAESIVQALALPYRIVELCTGDLSFASSKTFDIEVFAPASCDYLEISSISNFEDFQARRINIRFRNKQGKLTFAHTLNGSGVATPRLYIAILENYQNQDGTISVPDALKPYF